MKKDTRIILIGVGNMGSKYLNLLKEITDKVVLCDTDINKLSDKGFPYVCDVGDIQVPIPKAIIATNPAHHVNIAKRLLDMGANVLIEKPPATSYDEFISLNEFKNRIWISEIERFSICIKEFPKHTKPNYIEIKRLNKGRGYINPLWDLAWHDLYNLIYLFGDVDIENISSGHVWEIKGRVGEGIPFSLKVAWNHHFVDRSWLVHTQKGSIFMNFADEEIITEDGNSYTRRGGNKLLDMIEEFLDDIENGSFDRAAKILKMLDSVKDETSNT